MDTIGKRIRERRIALKLSQDELAKKLGYRSRSSINKIESNVHNLTQRKIKAIADALETTPAYIMGWEEEEPAPTVTPDSFLYALSAKTQVLTEENKAKLLEMADFFAQQQEKEQNKD